MVLSIIYGAIVVFGTLLCVVPGIITVFMFWPAQMLLVDRKMGVMESLIRSKEITDGNKLSIFVVMLAAAGITMLGQLTFVIGMIFAVPMVTLMMHVTYVRMIGQPTAINPFPATRSTPPAGTTPYQATAEPRVRKIVIFKSGSRPSDEMWYIEQVCQSIDWPVDELDGAHVDVRYVNSSSLNQPYVMGCALELGFNVDHCTVTPFTDRDGGEGFVLKEIV